MSDALQTLASYLALVVSIASAMIAVRVSREQTRLQAHLLRLETARERDRVAERDQAEIRATLTRLPASALLQIRNQGRSEARDLRVLIDGQDINEHELFPAAFSPPDVLGPDASFDFRMLTFDGMPNQYGVEISWKDQGGKPRSWSSRLSLTR